LIGYCGNIGKKIMTKGILGQVIWMLSIHSDNDCTAIGAMGNKYESGIIRSLEFVNVEMTDTLARYDPRIKNKDMSADAAVNPQRIRFNIDFKFRKFNGEYVKSEKMKDYIDNEFAEGRDFYLITGKGGVPFAPDEMQIIPCTDYANNLCVDINSYDFRPSANTNFRRSHKNADIIASEVVSSELKRRPQPYPAF
jgi:hypothetical protein